MDESDTFTLDISQEKNEREKEDFFEKKSKTVRNTYKKISILNALLKKTNSLDLSP